MNNELYEIKGWYDDTVDLKLNAAKDAGWQIHILTRINMLPIIQQVKEWYDVVDITTLYDQKTKSLRGCETEDDSAST